MADEHGQHVMSLAKALAGADGMIAGSGPAGRLAATSQGGPTENKFRTDEPDAPTRTAARAARPTPTSTRSGTTAICSIRR